MELRYEHFGFVGVRTWQQVLGTWAQQELTNDVWQAECARRGMTWFEWRKSTIDFFQLERRRWVVLQVRRPMVVVPRLRGGEHPDWERLYYDGQRCPTFSWLAANSTVESNPMVQRALASFPPRSTIIAVERGGSAVVVDGMHRCSALAFAARNGAAVAANLTLAIGE